MSIPIEIPGLNTLIPELEEGSVLLVDGGSDPAKSFFIRRLCLTALARNWPVTFVTSRDRVELEDLLSKENGHANGGDGSMPQILERDSLKSLEEFVQPGGLLAVDSFSFLTLDLGPIKLAGLLRRFRGLCRQKLTTGLLATDRGMYEGRSEAVATHLADGLLQFHAKEGPEGIIRLLRIAKWTDGRFLDRNIYYDFDGRRMSIDLRSRVL